jgi:peptidyl-prolyl cis-trans isomerase SurA
VGARSGKSARSAGIQRLWLAIFGALLVLLFIGFAVAQGIGQPSVPSGDAAIVEDVPDSVDGTISEAEFKRTVLQQAAQGGLKKTPEPGSTKYEELAKAAMNELLDAIWIAAEAEELGVTASDQQVEDELDKIKEQNFPTPKAFAEFLETSKFTAEDVSKRVRLQLLGEQIQERINGEAPAPSNSEIADYYDAARATQFTTKPNRDARLIISKSKADVEAAQKALEDDSSPANWKKVATKYSEDPTAKNTGGLQSGLSEEVLPEPLKGQVFGAATGELLGPIKYQGSFALVEVTKLNPEQAQPLKEVRSQIQAQLAQQVQQQFFADFVSNYTSKWTSRTFCASAFEDLIERCANFVGSGHPANAPAACYEADPKTPATECPAPVTQLAPALPGSTTVLQPQGERLPQRPRPPGGAEGAGEGAPLEGAAPEGAAPPEAGGE